MHGPIGLAALVLEVAAVASAVTITVALWDAPGGAADVVSGGAGPVLVPDIVAVRFGLADLQTLQPHGSDDTGEVARARRGLRLLDVRGLLDSVSRPDRYRLAWAVIAVDGMRRMAFFILVVVVLLSGRIPFDVPTRTVASMLLLAQLLLSVGHWMLSGGVLRPGARLRWSMASIGAGLGDGTSRTGMPIRWATTMAAMVALNVALSLRGVSDRWTHGLSPMPHDARVVTMAVSWWLVLIGFAALRILAQPSLGFYGATSRLEEVSTRRLALGTTLAVAIVGFVAGSLPGGLPA